MHKYNLIFLVIKYLYRYYSLTIIKEGRNKENICEYVKTVTKQKIIINK